MVKNLQKKNVGNILWRKRHSSGSWFSTNSNHSGFGWKIKPIVERGYESTSSTSVQKWCEKASEAAYTRNITYHWPIKMTPYEAVYDIKAIEGMNIMTNRKRQKVTENQENYNNEMITQSQKKNQPWKFKVGDIVSKKTDCVDRTSPLHSNLLGKIEEIVNTYLRVVTKFHPCKSLHSYYTEHWTWLHYWADIFCSVQESYVVYLNPLLSNTYYQGSVNS